MFNSSQKVYKIYRPQETVDSYNQKIVEYADTGLTASIFLSLNTYSQISEYATNVTQVQYVGCTTSANPQIGDLIDNQYEVVFVVEAGANRFLYLKDYDNGK